MDRLKKDLEHIKATGIDSGALYKRVCKYLSELLSYKATGLPPEEISQQRFIIATRKDPEKLAHLRDIVLADEAGRLAVLPCKPGDTVYFPVEGRWDSAVVDHIEIYPDGRVDIHWAQYDIGPDSEELYDCDAFGADQIGKAVFLTRQEANAAQDRMKRSGGT